jgi:predicted metalloendopeptidase
MVEAIVHAFEGNLDGLTWMDAGTKARARYKVHKLDQKIGYPDRWRSYDQLITERKSFLANLMAASAFETARDLRKIGKPLDRTEWRMTPPTVTPTTASLNRWCSPLASSSPPTRASHRHGELRRCRDGHRHTS